MFLAIPTAVQQSGKVYRDPPYSTASPEKLFICIVNSSFRWYLSGMRTDRNGSWPPWRSHARLLWMPRGSQLLSSTPQNAKQPAPATVSMTPGRNYSVCKESLSRLKKIFVTSTLYVLRISTCKMIEGLKKLNLYVEWFNVSTIYPYIMINYGTYYFSTFF